MKNEECRRQNIAAKLLNEYALRHENAAFREAEPTYFGQNAEFRLARYEKNP